MGDEIFDFCLGVHKFPPGVNGWLISNPPSIGNNKNHQKFDFQKKLLYTLSALFVKVIFQVYFKNFYK